MPEFLAFGSKVGRRACDFRPFVRGFIAAALFTGDHGKDSDSLTGAALSQLVRMAEANWECRCFREAVAAGLMDEERAGQCLWYVANGDGVGFHDDFMGAKDSPEAAILDRCRHVARETMPPDLYLHRGRIAASGGDFQC